jgi:hypothetical protein
VAVLLATRLTSREALNLTPGAAPDKALLGSEAR